MSRLAQCTLVGLAVWGIPAGAAHAAFPGRDGRLAFDSFAQSSDCEPDAKVCPSVSNVLTVKTSGRGLRVLTACEAASDRGCGTAPAWSPDGNRIAFAGESGIWVMNADGSDAHPVGGAGGVSPAWSPDGARVAFQPYSGGIATIRSDGSELRRLTTAGTDHDPVWSKSGAIAFVRNRPDFGSDIVTMAANGKRLRAVVRRCVCTRPDYSPDGRWIAYERGVREQIYVVKRDGTASRRITRSGGEDPAWSPSARHLAYVRGGHLYVVQRDGEGAHRVSYPPTGEAEYGAPSWQPRPR